MGGGVIRPIQLNDAALEPRQVFGSLIDAAHQYFLHRECQTENRHRFEAGALVSWRDMGRMEEGCTLGAPSNSVKE